jgi:DNA-binding CsgD family transcriptional regulator
MLEPLGLSHRHEVVYRAMLNNPGLGATALAELLEVAIEDVREALDGLADLALIRMDGSEVPRAVRPQVGLMALLGKVEADIAVRQQQIEAIRAAISAIAVAHDEETADAPPRRLSGIDAVRERLMELSQEARTECLSFSTGGGQAPDTIEAEKPLNEAALARGLSIRNLYLDSFRNDPNTMAYARWMAERGGESRTVPTLPMRMVVVDRELALVPVDPAEPRAGALEVRSPGVVAGLVALFTQMWEQGTPFAEPPPRDAHGLTTQERELVRLLATGCTDEAAARRLAVSVRSVQRMMTALTEKLDASSRFQAGVEAHRSGWI